MTALVTGVLVDARMPAVEAHLASCAVCVQLVADAARGIASRSLVGPVAASDRDGSARAAESEVGWPDDAASAEQGPRATQRSAQHGLRRGDVLAGKYRVEQLVGRGGMGQVFAAVHMDLGQEVAIELLHRAGPGLSERLIREARTCARLRTNHIPRVFDLGRHGGQPYIVMEYLQGEDLAAVLARGPVALSDAAGYVLQACAALNEAHRSGIVHRDLKPANLFLTRRPEGPPLVKVLDFGISKVLHESHSSEALALTTTGTVLGSPQYMSPEQILARPDVDERSDVWSLGVILHELLVGDPPFRATTLSALSVAIATQVPPPVSSLRGDVPAAVDRVVSGCLQKDRALRFASVAALMQALAPFAGPRHTLLVSSDWSASPSDTFPVVPPPAADVADPAHGVRVPFAPQGSANCGGSSGAHGVSTGSSVVPSWPVGTGPGASARVFTGIAGVTGAARWRRFALPAMLGAVLAAAVYLPIRWRGDSAETGRTATAPVESMSQVTPGAPPGAISRAGVLAATEVVSNRAAAADVASIRVTPAPAPTSAERATLGSAASAERPAPADPTPLADAGTPGIARGAVAPGAARAVAARAKGSGGRPGSETAAPSSESEATHAAAAPRPPTMNKDYGF